MTTVTMEEYELMKDSKYRMYVAAVDKALKNFEYTSEWADLISALGKLNKVLLGYQKFPVIPRRIKISKRLAQCMHPALPSGVHLKALETYDIIFRGMGTNRLACELFIYSAGLFPLMGHAAMNIRPTLLTIYETHFVPLGDRLRPALSGFLSGILPGLDTGTDHIDRTNKLLENVCDGVEPPYFYTCIWQCVANNSPVRLPAITFVLSHYNRKWSMEDQLFLMGHDIGLMVSGLCAAVQDSSVLVQRSALDLLMVCFPMHNKQLLYADMVRLVTAALTTILRRDMSLNRRLYSWLLETDSNSPNLRIHEEEEEEDNGLPDNASLIAYDLLNDAIKDILKKSSTEIPIDIKPYRLLTTLFDKPQIGPIILDNILYDVFRALYLSCLNVQKHKNQQQRRVSFNGDLNALKTEDTVLNKQFVVRNCNELTKNANLLFNTLQSYYIWSYVEKLYDEAVKNIKKYKYRDRCLVNEVGSGPPYILEICLLTDFLLDLVPVESSNNILPNLFNKVISCLKAEIHILNQYEITKSLELCMKILTKIQPVTITTVEKQVKEDNFVLSDNIERNIDLSMKPDSGKIEQSRTIEKSNSDSKINENLNGVVEKGELLSVEDLSRERSYSNQMIKKKFSPRFEKKPKNKKSKSSSKLSELKNEEDESQQVVTELPITPEKQENISVSPDTSVSTTPERRIENKYFTKCLEEYKCFYVSFIKTKILPNIDIDAFFRSLTFDANQRINELQQLLDDRLDVNKKSNFMLVDYPKKLNEKFLKTLNYALEDIECDYENSMNVASSILLEFCGFPNPTKNCLEKTPPLWLEALVASACCKDVSREVQIAAISTLLEIFSLAKMQGYTKTYDCNTNVVITGILEHQYVWFIEEHTVVIEEMSKILWTLLALVKNQNQLMLCVTLLYQIHNTFDTKIYVEQVLGNFLSQENINADYMKQFCMLWHLGRDLSVKLPPHRSSIRNFDRSLLKILDLLQSREKPTLQLLAETFLNHSLLHGDLPRILQPLILKLLHSNTARVSIRHVNIQEGDSQETQNIENEKADAASSNVYAVSNVNGTILYHDNPTEPKPKKKWFTFSKTGKKFAEAINMTTSLIEDSNNVVTKKNKDFKVNVSPNIDERDSKGKVKLIINPLSTKEVYPDGVEGSYSKIDSHSSSESLSSNDNTISNDDFSLKGLPNDQARDSGYESINNKKSEIVNALVDSKEFNAKKSLMESIEPISDGIKARNLSKSHSFDENTNMKHIIIDGPLVQSWSYSISDSTNLHGELERGKCAEEFFDSKNEELIIVTDILNDLIDKVCEKCESLDEDSMSYNYNMSSRPTELDLKYKINANSNTKNFVLYPMHSHICLYYDIFDSNIIIYSLQTVKNCILSNPQLFIKCSATSGAKDLGNNEVLNLLARHKRSLLGGGFSGDVPTDYVNFYRGYMFLDIIISICLNYARTFFPFMDDQSPLQEELENNMKIQLESLEILNIVIKNLINMVEENSNKGFCSYIGDLLVKCKIQKILLNCLLTSVRNYDEDITFAEEILLFNNFQLCDGRNKVGQHVEAFQIELLRLIHSLIILEHSIFLTSKMTDPTSPDPISPASGDQLNYKPTNLIPKQQIFLSAILSALRNEAMRHLHEKWLNMVTSCLPYFGDNLKQISISVIHQICNNIEEVAKNYRRPGLDDETELCSDYAVAQLESLTILCHYCLLDSSQTVNQNIPANINTTSTNNAGEILTNLVNVFFSPLSNDINFPLKQNSDHYQSARKTILSHMPRIISSVAKLWQTVVSTEGDYNSIYGSTKVVKQQLLEFLSPIAVHHGASFLAAIAVAWYERRNVFAAGKAVLPEPNAGQNNLVYLISAIRVIPLDNLVQTVNAVIKNPPHCEGLSSDILLDVSVLELFYCYMRNASATQMSEAWPSLLSLIKEVGSLNPPAQFLLAALLHEMMIKCCPLEERKDQKDLQDVTAKLIDCISIVCGSCLEQTTWLRRNYAVKEQEQDDTSSESGSVFNAPTEVVPNSSSSHSVQAQLVLAELLAPMLDICFGSIEKDKVNNILISLMTNIVPYMRTHTLKNMPSFNACSKLLASLSSYQYTRKAWKKDVFDLLLDNTLFQMDHSSIKFWRMIVDNLMTHDNTTFRDLMNRVSMTQSGSLSIFSSREAEYEQKSQLLKRLAYVIFCSEVDQYGKYMPEIQEQLATNLRLSVPGIQAQVFLCFRVLLIRMSPMQVTSLWPIIISEMLQVFLQIEQELSTDTEEFSSHIKLMSSLDASWATNSSNGLHALGHPHWLKLQLATAKLLDLTLLLPATTLPQFQMYRWAFVGDDPVRKTESINQIPFTPHVVRIAELMDRKFTDTQIDILPMKRNELLLTMNNITQLKDLHSFFKTLSSCSDRHRTECSKTLASDNLFAEKTTDKQLDLILEKIDKVIEGDFLEKIPR